MNSRTVLLVAILLAGSQAFAQLIILPPGPAAPGSTITVTLVNNTTQHLGIPCGNPLSLLHDEGGIIVPPVYTDCYFGFPPGTTATTWLTVPASGPGSNGSFVLRSHYAAARLDVGAPSNSFPAIHSSPASSIQFGRHKATGPALTIQWAFSNTSATPHTFGAGDMMSVYAPGASTPIGSFNLAGYTVPANLTLEGPFPVWLIPLGPYTIESTWMDPGTGSVVTVRQGINVNNDVDINLPGGHVIPAGGALPVDLNISGFPSLGPAPIYAFCIGVLPGTTPAQGGLTFPLAVDTAVIASLVNGIGGLLVSNVGNATSFGNLLVWSGTWTASGIGVTHPGPAFSGLVVRAGAFAHEPTQGLFAVSQGEDLLIQ